MLQDNTYVHDSIGRLTAVRDNRLNKTVGSINTDASQTFSYDDLSQVVGSTDNVSSGAVYRYDGMGNLVSDGSTRSEFGVTSAACGSGLVCIENYTGTVLNWRAAHDSEGKRVRFEDHSVRPASIDYYGYDYRQRLASLKKNGMLQETYNYNYKGDRTQSIVWHPGGSNNSFTTTWFVGNGYQVRQASNNTARWARTMDVVGQANWTTGDLILNQASESTALSEANKPYTGAGYYGAAHGTYIRNYDYKGSPIITSRWTDGSVVTRHWFDVWGAVRVGNSSGWSSTTIEKFDDRQHEDYSNLIYYGARYYHPKTRRFITRDDRFLGNGALGYNRYVYAWNNPATFRDDGRKPAVPVSVQNAPGYDTWTQVISPALGGFSSGVLGIGLFAPAATVQALVVAGVSFGTAGSIAGVTDNLMALTGASSVYSLFTNTGPAGGVPGAAPSGSAMYSSVFGLTGPEVSAVGGAANAAKGISAGMLFLTLIKTTGDLSMEVYNAAAMTPWNAYKKAYNMGWLDITTTQLEAADEWNRKHPNLQIKFDPALTRQIDEAKAQLEIADDIRVRLAAQKSGYGYADLNNAAGGGDPGGGFSGDADGGSLSGGWAEGGSLAPAGHVTVGPIECECR